MYDVLAIGAHPDDELFMGGTLAKMADQGYQCVVADLTRGERGSRGSPDMRRREAQDAAAILGLAKRISLDLGDSEIGRDPGHRLEVIRLLRSVRPTLVFTHDADDRNPDHVRANQLVREALFYSYVKGVDTGQERHKITALIEYFGNPTAALREASFVVPITETFERKLQAMRAYKSQFYNPEFDAPETYISSRTFFDEVEIRARYWGSLIGEKYGESFRYRGMISVSNPVVFFQKVTMEGAEEPDSRAE